MYFWLFKACPKLFTDNSAVTVPGGKSFRTIALRFSVIVALVCPSVCLILSCMASPTQANANRSGLSLLPLICLVNTAVAMEINVEIELS